MLPCCQSKKKPWPFLVYFKSLYGTTECAIYRIGNELTYLSTQYLNSYLVHRENMNALQWQLITQYAAMRVSKCELSSLRLCRFNSLVRWSSSLEPGQRIHQLLLRIVVVALCHTSIVLVFNSSHLQLVGSATPKEIYILQYIRQPLNSLDMRPQVPS